MQHILLTENGLQQIRLEELKFYTQFKGWHCRAGDSVYNFLLDEKVHLSNTICRKLEDIPVDDFTSPGILFKKDNFLCPLENCYCGMDIGIPKGINLDAINQLESSFRKLSHQERIDLPHYDGSYSIMAAGLGEFILQNIIHIDFFMGKRCNFDCSYCSPTIHDNKSPYPSLEKLNQAYTFLIKTIQRNDPHWQSKTFNFIFHGGEPTLVPSYLEFIEIINTDLRFRSNIKTLTNLSRSVPYLFKLNQLSNVLFSVHLDYINDAFLNKVRDFLDQRDESCKILDVKIMYQKKYIDKIEQIITLVKNYNNLNFMITPLHSKTSKNLINYDSEDRKYFKIIHSN